jgi:carboxymethylenebutenolidase
MRSPDVLLMAGLQREGDMALDQRIIDLYDDFTHGGMTRRGFLDRLTELAGSAAVAAAMLPLLQNNYAQAAIVADNDTRLATERVSYDSPKGRINGYLARGKAKGKRPAVLVIHENRGLNPHIEDVARRLAVEGFLALAPDGLSPLGGTPADADQARDLIGKLDPAKTRADYLAALTYLAGRPEVTGKLGVVGFCWGGGMANQVAVHAPALQAAVAFYGATPGAADVPKIRARLLLHYAGLDTRINAGIPAYEAALKQAGTKYGLYLYEGVNHAFHNDTAGARYDKAAAQLAWSRTVAFFKDALAG